MIFDVDMARIWPSVPKPTLTLRASQAPSELLPKGSQSYLEFHVRQSCTRNLGAMRPLRRWVRWNLCLQGPK